MFDKEPRLSDDVDTNTGAVFDLEESLTSIPRNERFKSKG